MKKYSLIGMFFLFVTSCSDLQDSTQDSPYLLHCGNKIHLSSKKSDVKNTSTYVNVDSGEFGIGKIGSYSQNCTTEPYRYLYFKFGGLFYRQIKKCWGTLSDEYYGDADKINTVLRHTGIAIDSTFFLSDTTVIQGKYALRHNTHVKEVYVYMFDDIAALK